MPKRETAPNGAPCWVDLITSDAGRSRDFYCNLFGWTAEEPSAEFGGYFMFSKDGIPVGGAMPATDGMPGGGVSDVWSIYLATDDVTKAVETSSANGGSVVVEPMAVADLGTMAVVKDSGGAAIGLWQPGTFHGFPVLGETGVASWFELSTRDYDSAIAFYRAVLGWDTKVHSDSPEFRYTTQVDTMLAGVMDASAFLPKGVPAHWSVYFGTADTDASLARVNELGGSTIRDPEDTPYGRLATAADPTGATFKLVAPNEAMPARPPSD